eukprot:gene12665-biopygen7954
MPLIPHAADPTCRRSHMPLIPHGPPKGAAVRWLAAAWWSRATRTLRQRQGGCVRGRVAASEAGWLRQRQGGCVRGRVAASEAG